MTFKQNPKIFPVDSPLAHPKTQKPHSLQLCEMCGEHIRCGYCGNNCCNGGTGTLPDGTTCGCDEAYSIQDVYFQQKDSMITSIYGQVILVDFDGVLGNWSHSFNIWATEQGHTISNKEAYHASERLGISMEEGNKITNEFNHSETIKTLPPWKDAIHYVKKLHEEHGFVFHCISGMPDTMNVALNRMENIKRLFGETAFEKLLLCDETGDKTFHLTKYKDSGCYWIDDLPKNEELGNELGLTTFLMDQPYNKDFAVFGTRVQNWKEIYLKITGE